MKAKKKLNKAVAMADDSISPSKVKSKFQNHMTLSHAGVHVE